jgi:peptide/nickel transport system permease protein
VSDLAIDELARPPAIRAGRLPGWARPGVVLAGLVVVVVVLWALVPDWFATADPLVGVPAEKLRPPSRDHWFGTDQFGRDVFARTVHAARLSMSGALLATAIAFAGGALLGATAGYVGGIVDTVAMRVVDVLLSVPNLLLTLMLLAAIGFGTTKVAIAVGIAGIARFARLARGEVLRVRTTDYVEAAQASGSRWWSVLVSHVIPNSIAPLVVLATLELGTAVLAIAAMSFLGYGAAPPTPEWGTLIADGRDYVATSWWISTMPGLVVAAVTLSFNRLSRALDAGRWRTR